MTTTTPFYKHVLRAELARRIGANPRYSLRAFARALAVDASVLSRVLADKRSLSARVASRVAGQLALSPRERGVFVESVVHDQKKRALERAGAPDAEDVRELDAEVFRIIGDVHHYALLELTLTKGFVAEPRWIAKKLGIGVLEAKLAMERLLRVGLLTHDGGTVRKTNEKVTTRDKTVTTPALRRHQRQILERAVDALENQPLEVRSMTGMTMAIDPDKLPLARQKIVEFMDELCGLLGSGPRTRVYQLGVSLYPLDKETT